MPQVKGQSQTTTWRSLLGPRAQNEEATAWGPATAYGAFQLYYTRNPISEYSATDTAWIGSLGAFLLTCSGVVAGPLFDRGHLKPILVTGCLLMVIGFMMLSLSTKYYQIILSQGLCFGLGAGLVCVPALTFVTSSFDKYRPYAVGFTMTGASFGGVIFPTMFINLVPQIGFAGTCRTFGFVIPGLSVLGPSLVWTAPTKKTKPRRLLELAAFTEPAYLTLALGFFLQFLGYWIPIFYIPTSTSSALGKTEYISIYAVSVFNVGSIFGRILPSWVMSRFGAINLDFVATVGTNVIFFCWIAVKTFVGYLVWCVAIGLSSSVFIPLVQ